MEVSLNCCYFLPKFCIFRRSSSLSGPFPSSSGSTRAPTKGTIAVCPTTTAKLTNFQPLVDGEPNTSHNQCTKESLQQECQNGVTGDRQHPDRCAHLVDRQQLEQSPNSSKDGVPKSIGDCFRDLVSLPFFTDVPFHVDS